VIWPDGAQTRLADGQGGPTATHPADLLFLVTGDDDPHPLALAAGAIGALSGDWHGEIDVVTSEPIVVTDAPSALADVLDEEFPIGTRSSRHAGSLPGSATALAGGVPVYRAFWRLCQGLASISAPTLPHAAWDNSC
jgi:hypothetical protein